MVCKARVAAHQLFFLFSLRLKLKKNYFNFKVCMYLVFYCIFETWKIYLQNFKYYYTHKSYLQNEICILVYKDFPKGRNMLGSNYLYMPTNDKLTKVQGYTTLGIKERFLRWINDYGAVNYRNKIKFRIFLCKMNLNFIAWFDLNRSSNFHFVYLFSRS